MTRDNNRAATAVVLTLVTLAVIMGALSVVRRGGPGQPAPRIASQADDQAFYIAQTALDRSVKALVANPRWRDGFSDIPFASGTYSVDVYGADSAAGSDDRSVPPNYVRIVASSEIDGVRKAVEAVWVNAMSAFYYNYAAGDRIEIGHEDGSNLVVMGNLHNNAWNGGNIDVHAGARVYGNVTGAGDIHIGRGRGGRAAVVYGNVWGARLRLSGAGRIDRYQNLSEENEGMDLNGDGDTTDIGLSGDPLRVQVTEGISVSGRPLADGQSDARIGGGMVPVAVGAPRAGPIVDPRPDFTAYYELVTGASTYPPALDHVASSILGDGDGHYFASAGAFIEWLRFHNDSAVLCWRCAGDGWIDPAGTTACPTCNGTGADRAVEVAGVFYVDDESLDLGEFGDNLVVHGTIVVASGNPYRWPRTTVNVPGEPAAIDHFPTKGRFVLEGPRRMHFTQTYRSDEEAGAYEWSKRVVYAGVDTQIIPVRAPRAGQTMHDFPAILAPEAVDIAPRGAGFAYHPGDIGDEALTVLHGVVFSGETLRIHGRGGWSGETLVFDEELNRGGDEALDESVLNIDLDGDGDIFDRVELSAVTTVPVVPVSNRRYNVDINSDGVLDKVMIGVDYRGFFDRHGYRYPLLVYHRGILLAQQIHTCEAVRVEFDPDIAAAGIPFGFEVSFGVAPYQGLVSWREQPSP
ncbi:MAG: hypothetical protein ACE5EO_03495 [Candidatus Krumholzibacteriia bacterium]